MDSNPFLRNHPRDSHYQQLPKYEGNQEASSGVRLLGRAGAVNNNSDDSRQREYNFISESTSSDDNSYSDSCSQSCDSSWSSDDSYVPEWEAHVDAHGELFYIQFSSNSQPLVVDCTKEECSDDHKLFQKKKKKKGHLSRLLNRRRKKKGATTAPESQIMHPPLQKNLNHLQDDWPEWTCFTIELEVHPLLEGSSDGQRKANHLCETLLGFTPGVSQSTDWHRQLSTGHRVIVNKLIPGGPLHQGFAHVQQGDWLEKLNGSQVTHRDLDDTLRSITSTEIVTLNFRRNPHLSAADASSSVSTITEPHGVLLLSQQGVTEQSPEMQDVLYQSETAGINHLLKWRGIASTLIHLMPQLVSSLPLHSAVIFQGLVIHVAYIVENENLLLIAAPSSWCTGIELQLMARQLECLLQFQYGSVKRALTEARFGQDMHRLMDFVFGLLATKSSDNRLAHYLHSGAQLLHLPTECHLDVAMTLNQMEAMDYQDWDDYSLTVDRSVTIIGSAVFSQGYLVASTLASQHLQDVTTYLKCNQILEMSRCRRLDSLVLWRTVFPRLKTDQPFCILVVGSGHILISVLLECLAQSWDNQPDSFLIEEVQFYLDELGLLDLESITNEILNGPQNPALVTNLRQDVFTGSDISCYNITAALKPSMINFVMLDFGAGAIVSPLDVAVGSQPNLLRKFHSTAFHIHKLFQQTLKAKRDLERVDWGGAWSDKRLVALQEVSILFSVAEAGLKGSIKDHTSFWVAGRLLTRPCHRELYVCYQEGVAQDMLDLAFHLTFGALH